MELVFRKNDTNDMFVVLKENGTVELLIRSKNATGEHRFSLSQNDFDMMCEIRAKVRIDTK